MAYNSSKGPQQHGDVKFEGDPNETQIDFENDFIALKASGSQVLVVSGTHVGVLTASPATHPAGKNDFVIGNQSGHRGATIASGPTSISTIRFTYATAANNGEGWIDYSNNSKNMRFGTNGLNTRLTISDNNISSSYPISASAFYANGALVTAPPITTYSNAADNRVITSVNSTSVQGEAGLTYNGSILAATGQISASLGVTGSSLRTATTVIDATHISSSLHVSASKFFANGVEVGGGGAVTSYTNSGDNRIVTSVNSNTINGEARLTFDNTTNFLFLSGNAQITNHLPYIFFSNSAGTGLGYMGYNSANNILIQNNSNDRNIVFKTSDGGVIKEGLRLDGAVPEVVVNQTSDSLMNFRVESDNEEYMLYVQGSTDRVGVNCIPNHTLSVSGSTSISGSASVTGSLTTTGAIRGKQLYYTNHQFVGAGDNSYFPFGGTSENASANEQHAMVVPHDGRLVKILFRVENAQNTSFTLRLIKGANGVKEIDSAGAVEVEAMTATLPASDATTVTFTASGSAHYLAGDIVGIKNGNFATSTGDVGATCIWEFDQLIP